MLASEAGDRFMHRAQKWFLERMSDSMQIESLWTFNEKFQPEWHARYACYDSTEHMLGASIAVARAESFFELPIIGRFFAPTRTKRVIGPPRLPAAPAADEKPSRTRLRIRPDQGCDGLGVSLPISNPISST